MRLYETWTEIWEIFFVYFVKNTTISNKTWYPPPPPPLSVYLSLSLSLSIYIYIFILGCHSMLYSIYIYILFYVEYFLNAPVLWHIVNSLWLIMHWVMFFFRFYYAGIFILISNKALRRSGAFVFDRCIFKHVWIENVCVFHTWHKNYTAQFLLFFCSL